MAVARHFLSHCADACIAGTAFEGWTDPWQLLQAFKRKAVSQGVTYVTGRAAALSTAAVQSASSTRRVNSATVIGVHGNETSISCGWIVNAAGAWSAAVAAMAGVPDFPVAPKKRCVFVAQLPGRSSALAGAPLLVDPSGAYFRPEGATQLLCGVSPPEDADPDIRGPAADTQVTNEDHTLLFDEFVWPVWTPAVYSLAQVVLSVCSCVVQHLGTRVPLLQELKVVRSWAGLYDMNVFDHNALIGTHADVANMVFCTGFSGHGLQQAPAAGRAVAELVVHGKYASIDVSRLRPDRYRDGAKVVEENVV